MRGFSFGILTVLLSVQMSFALRAESQSLLEEKVDLVLQGETLEQALHQLQVQTGINFVYSSNDQLNKKVSYKGRKEDLRLVLSELLKGTGLSYEVVGNNVVIRNDSREINFEGTLEKRGEERIPISGLVKDEQDNPLPGVTIRIVGSAGGTITNEEGRFELQAESSDSLEFSFVGYETQTLPIGKSLELNVTLEASRGSLNEVIVVGYGTQKKESVISSISNIDPKVLQSNQSASLSNGLAGQVPGVIAVQRSGEPGFDKSDFWIRGINTFGANSTPLVLVDGVERELNSLSPEEIESFTILKDATATAVYGVRGANGVILITTKTGKVGQPTVSFKFDRGVSKPTQLPQFVGAAKYMETINIANQLSGLDPSYTDQDILRTRTGYDSDLYPDVNWMDAITRSFATQTNASVDINGGSERLKYSFVGAFMNENGIITSDPDQEYNSQLGLAKYNLRTNLDFNLTNSTRLSVKIGGYITDRRAPGGPGISTIISHAMDTPPDVYPVVYSNGQLPKIAARYNPWADATQTGYRKTYQSTLQTQVNLRQDIGSLIPALKGLNANILASFDSYSSHEQRRDKEPFYYIATGRDDIGDLVTTSVNNGQDFLNYSNSASGNRTIYLESRLNYNRTVDDKHNIDGLFMFNMRDHVDQNAGSSILALPYRSMGIAGRAGYNYELRYFAEFDFGYNGSENFRRGLRFGFFPSFALGWMPSNEPFFEPLLNVISKLKFRGSYGLSGNDQIVDNRRFAYISTIEEANGFRFGYDGNNNFSPGYHEGEFGVPDLTWETAEKLDIGIELGFLGDAINLQVDYFNERRKDIFMQRKTIPETAGFNSPPFANFGRVMNQGVEFELEANRHFSNEFTLSARATFTHARNKVIEFDEPESLKNTTRARTGRPLNQHFGMVATGLYTASDFEDPANGILKSDLPQPMFGKVMPGDIKYKDLNGDGVVDGNDETAIGDPYVPETIFGFGISASYKDFDLSFLFQGATNFTNMLNGSTLVPGSGGGGTGNVYANVDDRWNPDKAQEVQNDVLWPRLSATESSNNMRYSTWWIIDASYLRLKYVEVGYTLPKSWRDKLRMKNARLYLRGSNLVTFAPFKMWDPEIGSQDGLRYPLDKVGTIGIQITF